MDVDLLVPSTNRGANAGRSKQITVLSVPHCVHSQLCQLATDQCIDCVRRPLHCRGLPYWKSGEIQADISLLVECIKFQLNNVNAVTQALITISKTCSAAGVGQDILRENGGLKYINGLWISTTHVDVRNAAMFCLACASDKNVYSQKILSTGENFSHLHKLLSDPQIQKKTSHAAMYLLLSLMANNSIGQTLLRKSNCLEKILHLFEKTSEAVCDDVWLDDNSALDLWSAVTSVLSTSVNNPQNDENQRVCTSVFPKALSMLDQCQPSTVRSLATFIGLTVANNVHNQTLIEKCSGLDVLVSCLHRAVNRCKHDSHFLQLAAHLVGTIDSVIADNARNCSRCVELGVVPLLLQLLTEDLEESLKLQVILALAHCTENSVSNQIKLVENGGLGILIKQLSFAEDEEYSKSVRYVLQTFVNIDKKALQSNPSQVKQTFDSGMILLRGLDNQQLWPTVQEHKEDPFTEKLKELENKLQSAEEENQQRCQLFSIESSNALFAENSSLDKKNTQRSSVRSPKYSLDLTKECDLESLASLKIKRKTQKKAETTIVNSVSQSAVEKQLVNKVAELQRKLKDQRGHIDTPAVTPDVRANNAKVSPSLAGSNVGLRSEQALIQRRLEILEEKFEQHYNSQEDSKVNTTESSRSTERSLVKVNRKLDLEEKTTEHSSESDAKYRKLQQELHKERELRRRLEREAAAAQLALEERRRAEEQAARRARLLAEELVRQELEQEEADQHLQQQVEESVFEHGRLTRLKEEKEQELKDIEERIHSLRTFAHETGIELTSPISVLSVAGILTQSARKLPVTSTPIPHTHSHERSSTANVSDNNIKIVYPKEDQPSDGNSKEINNNVKKVYPKENQPSDENCKEINNKDLQVKRQQDSKETSPRIVLKSTGNTAQCKEIVCVESKEPSYRGKVTCVIKKSDQNKSSPVHHIQRTKQDQLIKPEKSREPAKDDIVFLKPKTPPRRKMQSTDSAFFQSHMVSKRASTYTTSTDSDSDVNTTPRKVARKRPGHKKRLDLVPDNGMKDIAEVGQGDGLNVVTGKSSSSPPSPTISVDSNFDDMLMKTAQGCESLNINSVPNTPTKSRLDDVHSKLLLKTPVSVKTNVRGSPNRLLQTPLSVKKSNRSLSYSPKMHSVIKLTSEEQEGSNAKRTLDLNDMSSTGEISGKESLQGNVESDIEDGVQPLEVSDQSGSDSTDSGKANKPQTASKNKCPGCQPPEAIGFPLLNSHNFNIALETNPFTCAQHRALRQHERQLIFTMKRDGATRDRDKRLFDRNNNGSGDTERQNSQKSQKDVYEFMSSSGEEGPESEGETDVNVQLSPLRSPVYTSEETIQSVLTPNKSRRTRIPYSKQEEFNLIHGVDHMGKFWRQILNTYQFHESRTAADLMEKYKRMNYKKKESPQKCQPSSAAVVQTDPQSRDLTENTHQKHPQPHQPFSMAEDRRLCRGVKLYGNNWSVILHSFQFSKSRTGPELRERWRTMHKHDKTGSTN